MRCGASNKCGYCAWLTSVENSLVVGADARDNAQPTVGFTLTTHRAGFSRERFSWCTAKLMRDLRDRHGPLDYCGLVEWSTGSGGHGRLMHLHGLMKGLDGAAATACEADTRRGRCGACEQCLVSLRWEKLTEGAWRVDVRELRTPGGAIAYTVGHHHKTEQAPPAGLRGVKRMRPSRGYFSRPIEQLRQEARGVMAAKSRKRVALASLVDYDAPEELLDELLAALLDQADDQPRPQPARVRQDGAVVSLVDGRVLERGARTLPARRKPESEHTYDPQTPPKPLGGLPPARTPRDIA